MNFLPSYACPNARCTFKSSTISLIDLHLASSLGCNELDFDFEEEQTQEWDVNDENDEVIDSDILSSTYLSSEEEINTCNALPSIPTIPQPPFEQYQGQFRQYHPNVCNPLIGEDGYYLRGSTVLEDALYSDEHAQLRQQNIYHPFRDYSECELGFWLESSGLPQTSINDFLKLQYVQENPPSYKSAADLRSRIESLPPAPAWHSQEVGIPGYKTKSPMVLYYRDGLEVVMHMFRNPIFAPCMEYTPYICWEQDSEGAYDRQWSEYMSADHAWKNQSKVPQGHGILGVIGSSDKTTLTVGTGTKSMWPVSWTLANLSPRVRTKASAQSLTLGAYLPIPEWTDDIPTPLQTLLTNRVYHWCINHITLCLKEAAKTGIIMTDPVGHCRVMHTILASWIADLPEQQLIAGVRTNQEPTSLISLTKYGESGQEQPVRTRDFMEHMIAKASQECDPWDLAAFNKLTAKYGLNGVTELFYSGWAGGETCDFLTFDILHSVHKFFFDHPLKWVLNMMGDTEFDSRVAILQPMVGYRHWSGGISRLKNCTGKEHREMESTLIVTAVGAIPLNALQSLRSLMEFIFHVQDEAFFLESMRELSQCLFDFHKDKPAIAAAGGRLGKKKGKSIAIEHFRIPKLQALARVVRGIHSRGAPFQYSTDATEKSHGPFAKIPFRRSNRREYHSQCCAHMDRVEKVQAHQLFLTLAANGKSLLNPLTGCTGTVEYPVEEWLDAVMDEEGIRTFQFTRHRKEPNLFTSGGSWIRDERLAFKLTQAPHEPFLSVQEAAQLWHLPDLHGALVDYFYPRLPHPTQRRQQRREFTSLRTLPCNGVRVWHYVRIQTYSAVNTTSLLPARTLQALPPSQENPYGRCNPVIAHHKNGKQFSMSDPRKIYIAIQNHNSHASLASAVVQIRMILQPCMNDETSGPLLVYAQHFRFRHIQDHSGVHIVVPDAETGMFAVERVRNPAGAAIGDILELDDIRAIIQLAPDHRQRANPALNCDNALEMGKNFFINDFHGRENFQTILSFQ